MINSLNLVDVGPTRRLNFKFAPRLNVITGSNGTGKSFLLETLWWALTTTWAGEQAIPWQPPMPDMTEQDSSGFLSLKIDNLKPLISSNITVRESPSAPEFNIISKGVWDFYGEKWRHRYQIQSPRMPKSKLEPWPFEKPEDGPQNIAIYFKSDGGCAIFDSLKVGNWSKEFTDASIIFREDEIWSGKKSNKYMPKDNIHALPNGLIADLTAWQESEDTKPFESLRKILHFMGLPSEPLILGQPKRITKYSKGRIPTISSTQGDVPIIIASASVRRVLAMAYIMVWARNEHFKIAKELNRKTAMDVVFLIDEPELHLHPGWQRFFLPALLRALSVTFPNAAVQMFASTTAPLVLSSLESVYNDDLDNLTILERTRRRIRTNTYHFSKEGDVSNWLSSDVFGKVGGRSREAELAIQSAMDYMAGRFSNAESSLRSMYKCLRDLPILDASILTWLEKEENDHLRKHEAQLIERIHKALRLVLSGHDDFWVQWVLTWQSRHNNEGSK